MHKIPGIPTRDLPRIAWQRLMRELRTRTAPRKRLETKIGSSIEEIAKHFRTVRRPRFFGLLAEHATLIGRFFPEAQAAAIEEADKIRAHYFDILGSGEV